MADLPTDADRPCDRLMSTAAQVWSYRTLISNLVQRDLKSRYKRSVLGWSWSLINPLATLLVYSLVFGVILRGVPPVAGNGELQNYAIFLFCGLVAWNAFYNTYTAALNSLEDAGPLLTKVYFPPECPPIAGALSEVYQTAIEMLVLLGVMVIVGNLGATTLLAPLGLIAASVFGLGLGMVAGLWNVRYRDVAYTSTIVLQLLFYGTPIIYPRDIVPETAWGWLPLGRLIDLNPMTHFVGVFRDLVYGLELPSVASTAYASFFMLGALALGWWTYASAAPRIIEEL
ncbi:MAG: ABC transporter permease [Microthrixaceae bacterium]